MSNVRHGNTSQPFLRYLYRTICISMIWTRGAAAIPQSDPHGDGTTASVTTQLALIPSALAPAPIAFAPTEALRSSKPFPSGLIPSAPSHPPNQIPTRPGPETFHIPSEAQSPSTLTRLSGLISFGPPSITNLPPSITSVANPNNTSLIIGNPPVGSSVPSGNATIPRPPMVSTTEGLKPIPAPSTDPGDPDGHHEIPEPNFTATASCRGCSPALEIPATGWSDTLPSTTSSAPSANAKPQESPGSAPPPQATITIGPSKIIIRPEPTTVTTTAGGSIQAIVIGGGGRNFIIDTSTTLQPGKTITIAETPLVIQISSSHTEIVLAGTQTISFPSPSSAAAAQQPLITNPPTAIPLPITIDSQTFTPILKTDTKSNANSDANPNNEPPPPTLYVISSQTLTPGGPAITISSTIISLPTTPTAVIINGQTTTLPPPSYGAMITQTTFPYLTLWHTSFTPDASGNYVIAAGTTLRPGGQPVTMQGTIVSLLPGGTEVVVQGSTRSLAPRTTVITLTRSAAGGSGGGSASGRMGSVGATLPYPAGAGRVGGRGVEESGVVEVILALGVVVVGWLAVWL